MSLEETSPHIIWQAAVKTKPGKVAAGVALIVLGLVSPFAGWAFIGLPLIVVIFGIAFLLEAWRPPRIEIDGEQLLVRHTFRYKHIQRTQIQALELGPQKSNRIGLWVSLQSDVHRPLLLMKLPWADADRVKDELLRWA